MCNFVFASELFCARDIGNTPCFVVLLGAIVQEIELSIEFELLLTVHIVALEANERARFFDRFVGMIGHADVEFSQDIVQFLIVRIDEARLLERCNGVIPFIETRAIDFAQAVPQQFQRIAEGVGVFAFDALNHRLVVALERFPIARSRQDLVDRLEGAQFAHVQIERLVEVFDRFDVVLELVAIDNGNRIVEFRHLLVVFLRSRTISP